MARRLAGRAVGVVLSGGGARAFAHLGVIERLQSAGVVVDRVGGVSMGAFIGGLLALGHDSQAIDACCYEEWVRRNPINDYTLPRTALTKGQKARAMLERVYGDVQIEELDRAFYSASVDLKNSSLVIDRDGPLYLAVGCSMALPLIAPPQLRAERVLIDGSLLDNLPLAPMSSTGEGPVLAVDIKGGEERSRQDAASIGDLARAGGKSGACACPRCRGRYPASPCFRARIQPKLRACTPTSRSRCGSRVWACSSFTRSMRLGLRAAGPPPRRSRNHRPGYCPSTCRSPTSPAGVRS